MVHYSALLHTHPTQASASPLLPLPILAMSSQTPFFHLPFPTNKRKFNWRGDDGGGGIDGSLVVLQDPFPAPEVRVLRRGMWAMPLRRSGSVSRPRVIHAPNPPAHPYTESLPRNLTRKTPPGGPHGPPVNIVQDTTWLCYCCSGHYALVPRGFAFVTVGILYA